SWAVWSPSRCWCCSRPLCGGGDLAAGASRLVPRPLRLAGLPFGFLGGGLGGVQPAPSLLQHLPCLPRLGPEVLCPPGGFVGALVQALELSGALRIGGTALRGGHRSGPLPRPSSRDLGRLGQRSRLEQPLGRFVTARGQQRAADAVEDASGGGVPRFGEGGRGSGGDLLQQSDPSFRRIPEDVAVGGSAQLLVHPNELF